MTTRGLQPPVSTYTGRDGHKSGTPWVMAVLVVITLLGAFLRFHGLSFQSLWSDELATRFESYFSDFFVGLPYNLLYGPLYLPGYTYLMYLVQTYVGNSEAILRLPSAIAGAVSVLIVYAVGARLFSRREGLIAAALMAVAAAPIAYSQEARPYSLLVMVTLLGVLAWVGLVDAVWQRQDMGTWDIVLFVVTAVAASYLHYFGMLLVFLEGVVLLALALRQAKSRRAVIFMLAAIPLALVWAAPIMVYHFFVSHNADWIQIPSPRTLAGFFEFLFNRSRMFTGVFVLCIGYLTVWSWRQYRATRVVDLSLLHTILLIGWLLVPPVLTFVISVAVKPIFMDRYLLIVMPAAYLIVARAITVLPVPRVAQAILAILFTFALLGHLLFGLKYYTTPTKEQWREAVSYVIQHDVANEDSLVVSWSYRGADFDYYFERLGSSLRVQLNAGEADDIPDFEAFLRERKPKLIWYISASEQPQPAFLAHLQNRLRQIDHQSYINAEVWLFAAP